MTRHLLLIVIVFIVAAPVLAQSEVDQPRNVILMIPDGLGPASITLARIASGGPLALDEFLTGTVSTTSADRYVIDSAASATAYASGVKTVNGALSVDSLGRPVGTVLQGARDRGMLTGLVTTTEITHATPAAFAAHVLNRRMVDEIAVQLMASGVDLMLGGGKVHFLPVPDGRRGDDLDLIEHARDQGYEIVYADSELQQVTQLPLLGLFADGHLAYEMDRHLTYEPGLSELTRRALDLLSGTDEGFFLMVEGGRIDHAAHLNDAAAHVFDILAYDEAVRVALDFAYADGHTLVVSVADHETGGLSVGRDGSYIVTPEILLASTASVDWITDESVRRSNEEGGPLSVHLLATILSEVTPLVEFDDEDLALLEAALDFPDQRRAARFMMQVVSRRTGIGWTTRGHTAVDVTLHAFGPGSDRLRGHLENDEVGRIIADLLDIDLDEVTERVRADLVDSTLVDW